MTSVQEWENKFGGNDEFAKSSRVGFDYELNVAYHVAVKSAKIIKTRREDVCLQLDLSVLGADDDVVGTSREWITLPKQVTDSKLPGETVRKLTFRRRDDVGRILASATPDKFAVFVERRQVDGKMHYIGPDGEPMSYADFKAREKTINAAVLDLSDAWHEEIGAPVSDLEGATFYVVKAPNKNNPDYPYTNIYSFAPEKIPVYPNTDTDG